MVLRSALFNVYFFALTALLCVLGSILRFAGPRHALTVPKLWARCTLAGLRAICGIGFEVTGSERLPRNGPALIASRHQSAFDTLVWLTLVPRCCYVIKQELARIPLFGGLIRPAGMILVDRSARAGAMRHLMREAARAASEGRQIVIFPEGTRAEPDRIGTLYPGVAAMAARTGLPVLPVLTDSGRFWGRRSFTKRPGVIRIVLLPPIPAGTGRDVVMIGLRTAFAQPVGGPCG